MTHRRPTPIDRRLDDYLAMKAEAGALAESVLETALYVEEAFGIVLDDADLTAASLGNPTAVRALVARKLGG